MARPLSTTKMAEMLARGDMAAMLALAAAHLRDQPTDHASARKVVNTVAPFAYKKDLPAELCGELTACLLTCVATVAEAAGRTDAVVKETYGLLYHVMARLVKQEELASVTALAPSFLQLGGAMDNPTIITVTVGVAEGALLGRTVYCWVTSGPAV